ncbi:DUF4129 domain-containing protein [Mycobacterium spongiae]|uniref:DUF4129 domain-containing protein n=1 Tax=Mycobacterium spongiae TaxID=886343 RepID=A0A975PWH9_9MYCO|nr:DUF4129 domain-containing protein [Mycobacterium spongiae]QUR66703.1 DUF4129 domain-containing protein [Mycobacterium spongiae]
MPGTKPGVDTPTGRVVAVIVSLILAGVALRGYLPDPDGGPLARAGGGRAALIVVVVALAGALAVMAVAVVGRLRDPRAVAPNAGELSDALGRGKRRPSWRVVLIGLGVILAWLAIAALLAHWFAPGEVSPPAPPDSEMAPSAPGTGSPPTPNQQDDSGDVLSILLASMVPLFLMFVASALIVSRRRRVSASGPLGDDLADPEARPTRPESLARAAEVGLAEMADLDRDPRQAIIACYAAMERELANVPGVAPQDFDTPSEVLARAVQHRALQADNAIQLVNLFTEARFSRHVMNEGHRTVAVRTLRLVLDELSAGSAA